MTPTERERARVLDNISMAFVNGKITKAQADEARAALIEEWRILDNEPATT